MHILRYLVLFIVVFVGLTACVEPESVKQTETNELKIVLEQPVQSSRLSSTPSVKKPETFVQMEHSDAETFVQLGHSSHVTSVAFSPDGQMVLSGSKDNTIKLWDVKSKKEIRGFQGHLDSVFSVVFSQDGKFILSGSRDNTMKLWDINSGQEIRSFKGHSNTVIAVAFSPNGQLALSGSYDKTCKLWDVNSGKEVRSFKGHSDTVRAIAFSPDGKIVLTGSDKLKLWNVNSGQEIRSFKGHSNSIKAVAFSPDGQLILSGSKKIILSDVNSGQKIHDFHNNHCCIRDLDFSSNGKLALLGTYSTFKLLDVNSGNVIHSFIDKNRYSINSVAFSPDGKLALSGSWKFKLWNVNTGQEIHSFKGYSDSIYAVTSSPDGQFALVASYETSELWDINSGRKIRSFKGHSSLVNAVAFSPDGKLALSGSSDNTIKLWNIKSGQEIRSFKGHSKSVRTVVFSPDGQLALSNSFDDTIKLWDINSGQEIRSFKNRSANMTLFSPNGQLVLSDSAYNLRLWDINNGRKIRSFEGHSRLVQAIAFSSDGKFALSGGYDNTIKLWDINTGQEIRSLHGHSDLIKAVAFSPNGQLALSGSYNNIIKLWDINTGKEIRSFKGHSSRIINVTFLPRDLMLSGSNDGTIRLWNLQTGNEIAQMVTFKDEEWITITSEGYYQASLNGAKYLNVRIGNQVYGIDQYEAIYYRPDIVKLALKLGDSQQAVAQLTRNAPPIQIAQVQPPKIWFVEPQQGYKTSQSSIEVIVETEEFVDSTESVTFMVNNRPVPKGSKSRKQGKPSRANVAGTKTQSYNHRVPLPKIGENWIEVKVRGKAGAEQSAKTLVMRTGTVTKLPNLYFLGIGVAEHPILPLKYPAKGVIQLAKTFEQQQGRAYKQVFIKTLTDRQATRGNLIQAITTFFKDAKQEDIAIVYISGHGMNTSMGYHFLTYDANPDSLETTGASWQRFDAIYDLPAHVLLWVDTCRAGNIVGNSDWKARAQADEARPDRFLRKANNSNVIVLASSSGNDVSLENDDWGHTAFAKALLDGLNGEAADKKGRVPFDMLRRHVFEAVEEMTDGLQKPTVPKFEGTGAFLDLILVKL